MESTCLICIRSWAQSLAPYREEFRNKAATRLIPFTHKGESTRSGTDVVYGKRVEVNQRRKYELPFL